MSSPELQSRLDTDPLLSNIRILGVDPGSMPSNLVKRGPWIVRIFMFKLIMPWLSPLMGWLVPNGTYRTLRMGATDILQAALSPRADAFAKGSYYYGSRLDDMSLEAKDEKKNKRLWADSVRYTGLTEKETSLVTCL